jgi:replicative DNA helicase
LNVASALIKQVLMLQDFETWSYLRKHYLPSEYHSLFKAIDKHCETFHKLPDLEELKLSTRDSTTLEKIYAIESLDVDAEPYLLLQYLKDEFTQRRVLQHLEEYVEESISFESAEESVQHLEEIIVKVKEEVELEEPRESMQRITLFEDEEDLGRYLALGLNADYDSQITFSPIDLILVGGKRGSGKSLTCANIANSVYDSGKSAIYFTIEMDSRAILQRLCSISTGIPQARLRKRNLNIAEWERVAGWWAGRFNRGQELLQEYREHRDFDSFHKQLTTTCELVPETQLDVVYDPSLTIGKIRAELETKIKTKMDIGVIIVDYINQVKRSNGPSRAGQYDWTEQIEVSKALKSMAQEYKVPVFSPYQTDASGEARFAKGILDAADAAFALEPWDHEDNCVTFKCVKIRNDSPIDFTSTMNWETLKMGPESAMTPDQREDSAHKTGESIDDL